MKRGARLLTLAIVSLPGVVAAHPGHGGIEGHRPLHYLLEHPLLAVGAVAVVFGSAVYWRRRRSSR